MRTIDHPDRRGRKCRFALEWNSRGSLATEVGLMNLLAIIVIFLALATAGAIAYIAWELSSDKHSEQRQRAGGDLEKPPDP
ncbi:MAG: hypothetical protein ACREQ8_03220 [Woeseiaceae bacterium]